MEKRMPDIKQIGILYSIVVILFLFIGTRVQRNEFYTGVLITEFIIIALPALVLLFMYRSNVKEVLRFNKASFLSFFLVFLIMVFAIPLVAIINIANLVLIQSIFGKVAVAQLPIADNSIKLLLNILVVGASAGICEEILFRGVIQRGFERFGVTKSILFGAFFFGLLHMDFQKLLGTFLLGALIGFIVYRTNSLFTGMFAHFTNNSIAVLIAYLSNKLLNLINSSGMGGIEEAFDGEQYFDTLAGMPQSQLIMVIIVWIFIALFCGAVLTGLIIGLIKINSERQEKIRTELVKTNIESLIWFIPGTVFVAFIYVVQGLNLRGINIEALQNVLRLMGAG